MIFESADPSIVKSVRQRDLLNAWLRLFAKENRLPKLNDYQPDRIAEEKPDLACYDIKYENNAPRFRLTYHGSRLAAAYGIDGEGMTLEDVIGPKFVPTAMPIYRACVARGRPVYSIYIVRDVRGREVAYERLLLPFNDGGRIDGMIASCKAISEDGAFEQNNLMHAAGTQPVRTTAAVIDRDLFHRMPGRIPVDDVIEFG